MGSLKIIFVHLCFDSFYVFTKYINVNTKLCMVMCRNTHLMISLLTKCRNTNQDMPEVLLLDLHKRGLNDTLIGDNLRPRVTRMRPSPRVMPKDE